MKTKKKLDSVAKMAASSKQHIIIFPSSSCCCWSDTCRVHDKWRPNISIQVAESCGREMDRAKRNCWNGQVKFFFVFFSRKTLGPKTIEIWIWIILITWKRDRRQAFKRCCWCCCFVWWHPRTTSVFARPFPCHFAVLFFFLGHKALKFMNFYCLSASADRQSPFQTLRNTFWCY